MCVGFMIQASLPLGAGWLHLSGLLLPPQNVFTGVCCVQYRAREARKQARLTTDPAQRRELLQNAEQALQRCLALAPWDGRTYVVLGKLYVLTRRFEDARQLYINGCAATGGWWMWCGWLERAATRQSLRAEEYTISISNCCLCGLKCVE